MRHILVLDTDKPKILREAAAIPTRLYAKLDYEITTEEGEIEEPFNVSNILPNKVETIKVEAMKVDTWVRTTANIPHALRIKGKGYKRVSGKPMSLGDLFETDHPLDEKDPPCYLFTDDRVLRITRWSESRTLGSKYASIHFNAYVYLPESRFPPSRRQKGTYAYIKEAPHD